MIESVQARQQGAYNFEDHYDNLCALQDSAPLPAVKAHLAQGVIDLNGDRVRLNDWQPIINTIRINKTLQFAAVRSYYQMPQEEDEKRAAILRRKLPSIRSKEITHRLVKALKECLFVSPCLSCVELQGLSLRDRDLQMLVKGIIKSTTLRHLSLEYCRIGDQGLEILCKGLKNSKNINSVNLSGCSLSSRGADSLAAVIKHQGMQRHNEAWRDSLRYRRPDLDRMSGLRRITANGNPMLGDEGARAFAEALKDDLWLKALDLQACGVGAAGARSFLEVLKYNTTLVVLDLRRNPLIERGTLHAVMEQLMLNSNGEDGEYKWMSEKAPDHLTPPKSQPSAVSKTRRRATKVLNSSLGKKTTIKGHNGNNSCSQCSRVTPTSSRRRARSGVAASRRVEVTPSPGLPWRTAARANRFRGHPPDVTRYLADQSSDVSTSLLHTSGQDHLLLPGEDDSTSELLVNAFSAGGAGGIGAGERNYGIGVSPPAVKSASAEALVRKLEESHMTMDLTNQKEVRVELEQMRRHLREERLARAKSDQKVVQMMIENRRLSEELERLKKTQNGTRLSEDESFLESVEASFKQFHAFIDMLREAGMGQLVAMAGLDQSAMPFANNGGSSEFVSSNGSNGKYRHHRNGSSNGISTPNSNNNNNNIMKTGGDRSKAYVDMPLTSSYTEGDPVVIGSSRVNVYGEESDAVRQEADELYSRLLQETRGALASGHEVAMTTAGSPSRPVTSISVAKTSGGSSRAQPSPDKSAASVEEESSSPVVSGRGQDDSGAEPQEMSAQDIDSGEDNF